MFIYIWFLGRHNDIGRCVRSGFPRRLWKRKSLLSFHKPFLRMAGEGQEEVEGKQQREKKVAGIWRVLGRSRASNCVPQCSTSTPSCSSSLTASVLQPSHFKEIFSPLGCAVNHLHPPCWHQELHNGDSWVCAKGNQTTGWPYWAAHTPRHLL